MQSRNEVVAPVAQPSHIDPIALELLARAESSVAGGKLALLELLQLPTLEQVPQKIRSRAAEQVRELEVQILALRSIRKAAGVSL